QWIKGSGMAGLADTDPAAHKFDDIETGPLDRLVYRNDPPFFQRDRTGKPAHSVSIDGKILKQDRTGHVGLLLPTLLLAFSSRLLSPFRTLFISFILRSGIRKIAALPLLLNLAEEGLDPAHIFGRIIHMKKNFRNSPDLMTDTSGQFISDLGGVILDILEHRVDVAPRGEDTDISPGNGEI